MRLPIGGMTIRPDPKDPNKSYVEHILEADLQGNIPQWIWTIVLKQGAHGLLKLRKLIPKYVKKNKDILDIADPF